MTSGSGPSSNVSATPISPGFPLPTIGRKKPTRGRNGATAQARRNASSGSGAVRMSTNRRIAYRRNAVNPAIWAGDRGQMIPRCG